MGKLKTFITLCLAAVIAFGCAARRIVPDETTAWTKELVVSEIGYDDKGLPVIGPALPKRPSGPGDRFSLVRLADGRPVISYDIAVVRQKPDYAKPFRTVYEWTGKGFKEGACSTGSLSYLFTEDPSQVQVKEATVLEMVIVVTPVTLGTVGGFVIGLVDGVKQTALELSKVVVNGEHAVTSTTYEYDSRGRLMYLRMYTPDRKQELVRTEFWYEDAGTRPVRTLVKSLAEGKEREIK